MEPLVDVSTLPPGVQRLLDPSAPAQLRTMAARGIAPGLRPGDALTLLALLSETSDPEISALASTTLAKLPGPLLNGALTTPLPAGVLDAFAPLYATDLGIMERVLAHPSITGATVARVAAKANEPVCELIATNEERLLSHPVIIEALYKNRATRMSTADRILELAVRNKLELTGIPAFKEAALAIAGELIAEPSDEPTPDDELFHETQAEAKKLSLAPEADTHVVNPETGEEEVVDEVKTLHARWASMSGSMKIRMLICGDTDEDVDRADRGSKLTVLMLGLRDPNPLVAVAAIKSPGVTESVATRIAAGRSTSEDVLRVIASNRDWTRSHQLKYNLVANPRTPFAFAAKWITHLRENEIKALTRSKDVSGAVRTAANQQLQRKGKQG